MVALSLLRVAMLVNSSREALVSWMAAACWEADSATFCEAAAISPIISRKFSLTMFIRALIWLISSRPCTSMLWVRSPWRMLPATARTLRMGRLTSL